MAFAKLRPRREIGFRVAPGDHRARRFRDEYSACKGKFNSLQHPKRYVKPSREFLPLERKPL